MSQNSCGFTLIEMLVVVAILGVLTGLMLPLLEDSQAYEGSRNQERYLSLVEKGVYTWAEAGAYSDDYRLVNDLDFCSTQKEKSLASVETLRGNAGHCYLSLFFEDQVGIFESGLEAHLVDVWGKPVAFKGSDVYKPESVFPEHILKAEAESGSRSPIYSKGPDGDDELGGSATIDDQWIDPSLPKNLDNVVLNVNLAPILRESIQAEVARVEAAIFSYHKKFNVMRYVPGASLSYPAENPLGEKIDPYGVFPVADQPFNFEGVADTMSAWEEVLQVLAKNGFGHMGLGKFPDLNQGAGDSLKFGFLVAPQPAVPRFFPVANLYDLGALPASPISPRFNPLTVMFPWDLSLLKGNLDTYKL